MHQDCLDETYINPNAPVPYQRVSAREQGRSGLGLAVQRLDTEDCGAREGFTIKSWYQDIQTGAGKDAPLLRPGLAAALKEARVARDTIASVKGKPRVPLSDHV
jgi:DNA invertase Pin-like site-specific DNA recombinase